MHFLFCQITDTTPQEQELLNSFTKQQYIDWSKSISNEEELQKQVDSLQLKLDKAHDIISKHEKQQEAFIDDINNLTELLLANNKKDDEADEKIKKGFKNMLTGFRSNAFIYSQDIQFDQINFSVNLVYDFGPVFVGGNFSTISIPTLETSERKATYSLLIGYNIF